MAEHVAHSGRAKFDIGTQLWAENLLESGCKGIIGVDGRIIL
jgi:hypothetical protein